MTTVQAAASSDAPEQQDQSRSRGDIAVEFARRLAGLAESHRGDLAELRRMDPEAPDKAVFWRLMAAQGLLGDPDLERKWALILHGIALMTPRTGGDGNSRTAHNGYDPVGRALYLGGDDRRENGFYSESRLNRLLTARGPMLRTLLARMFRMLAAAGVSFNWREMAQFILTDGYGEEAVEEARRRIARAYYQAGRRNAPASGDQEN